MADDPMPVERERELYLGGIRLFNQHEYFEAHEAWEEIWHHAIGVKHDFYQGMIQCAVALEHYRRSNPRGVISLSRSYPTKFRRVPERFMGLDVSQFLQEMKRALQPVVEAGRMLERGQIELDLKCVPQITLLYDPFETGEAEAQNRLAGW